MNKENTLYHVNLKFICLEPIDPVFSIKKCKGKIMKEEYTANLSSHEYSHIENEIEAEYYVIKLIYVNKQPTESEFKNYLEKITSLLQNHIQVIPISEPTKQLEYKWIEDVETIYQKRKNSNPIPVYVYRIYYYAN